MDWIYESEGREESMVDLRDKEHLETMEPEFRGPLALDGIIRMI